VDWLLPQREANEKARAVAEKATVVTGGRWFRFFGRISEEMRKPDGRFAGQL
jgi:hypothetical protein